MSGPYEHIDRYEVQEVVGRGAMGVVYRARDPVIGRVVALKTIDLPDGIPGEQRADSLERFAREARAAGLLSHPNIVTIYDVGKAGENGSSYIAMEFVEGRTLRQMVPHGERKPSEEILRIALQVARALDYAHRRGIIHRDVKPANILIRDDGLVKLADFGVARIESSELTRTGQSVGSPSYVAPEMLLDQPVDGRADLFSLGVILYEVLTGEKPFKGENLASLYRQILSETPALPSTRNDAIPREWDTIISRLLEKKPEDRYSGAAQLIEDLRRLEKGMPLCSEPTSSLAEAEPVPDWLIEQSASEGPAAPRPATAAGLAPQRRALLALLTVAGFALAIIGVTMLIRGRAPEAPPAAAAAETLVVAVAPTAELTVRLAHSLKAGRISVTMDGGALMEEEVKGEWSKMRVQGTLSRQVRIPAGKHLFKVLVDDGGGRQWTGATTREVGEGSGPTLFVEVKGFLKKSLDLTWY
jgi:serine/threonine-protein kinase